jgi:hypothetical protein
VTSDPEAAGPRLPQALGWVLAAATLVLLGLVKIDPSDVPWHLATARLAEAAGHWPTRNTFSWTFPDYTLYQQYPVFQTVIYTVYKAGGWDALSLLVCAGWTAVLALFVRAAGPWRTALPFFAFWGAVAFSLQTRTSLRPDLLSLTMVASYLILFEAYRRRFAAIALLPLLHWTWANGHQLFVLSFVIQGLFLAHLVLVRWGRLGVDRTDGPLPLWPPLAALAASIALTFATPLGSEVLHVFAHTSGSLAHHRGQVDELARVWSDPAWLAIALAVALPTGAVLVRSWRAWSPLEVGLWLLTLAMAASAIRALVYLTLVSGVVFQRALLRRPMVWPSSPLLRRYFRWLGVVLTAAMATAVLKHRWLEPGTALHGTQSGLGRTQGDWPTEAIAQLKPDPPPGQMMNLSWPVANDLIWDWPEQPVFVDPRFEAYPRAFLIDALASRTSDAVLDRLIATHRPGWLFVDHCWSPERDRVAHLMRGGQWQATYADVQALVLVPRTSHTESYRNRHPFTPAGEPGGLLAAPAGRRARQRLCYGRLLGVLGYPGQARTQLNEAAREAAGDTDLRAEIARAVQRLPVETTVQ